jgi:co-chaperonin GroES (HSP10)
MVCVGRTKNVTQKRLSLFLAGGLPHCVSTGVLLRYSMQFKKHMIVIGDRILLQLEDGEDRTKSGLYLPASVREKEKVAMGRVVKVGPGYPIPNPNYTEDEPWSAPKDPMRYIPLQAKEGDYAIFLREQGVEVEFEAKKYLIVPQSAVLMIVREELSEL